MSEQGTYRISGYRPGVFGEICIMGGWDIPVKAPRWETDEEYKSQISSSAEEFASSRHWAGLSSQLESLCNESAKRGNPRLEVTIRSTSQSEEPGYEMTPSGGSVTISVADCRFGSLFRRRSLFGDSLRGRELGLLSIRQCASEWAVARGLGFHPSKHSPEYFTLEWMSPEREVAYRKAAGQVGGYDAIVSGVPVEDIVA